MKVIASKLSSLQKNMLKPHSKTFYVENVWLAGKGWQTWHFKVQKPLVFILLRFGHVNLVQLGFSSKSWYGQQKFSGSLSFRAG
jgi:hypothetical protein